MQACQGRGRSACKRLRRRSGFSVWHSHTVITRQLSRRREAAWRLSRVALPSSFFATKPSLSWESGRLCTYCEDARSIHGQRYRRRVAAERCQDRLADRAYGGGSGSPWNAGCGERPTLAWCPCPESGSSSGCAPEGSRYQPFQQKLPRILQKCKACRSANVPVGNDAPQRAKEDLGGPKIPKFRLHPPVPSPQTTPAVIWTNGNKSIGRLP